MQVLVSALADGALVAAIASVLCLCFREHRLLDLAAGLWVVAGAWVFLAIRSVFVSSATEPSWCCIAALTILAVIVPAAVALRSEFIVRDPVRYL